MDLNAIMAAIMALANNSPIQPPASGGTPANPFSKSTAAFTDSVGEVIGFAQGLSGYTDGAFATAAQSTVEAYATAFQMVPGYFESDNGAPPPNPMAEFMTGAAAAAGAIDTILAAGATEVGSDNDGSGVVASGNAVGMALDTSGGIVAESFASGAAVFTAGALKFAEGVAALMAGADNGDGPGPGTQFANAITPVGTQVANGIDMGANALSTAVKSDLTMGIANGAKAFGSAIEDGSADLAAAIGGFDIPSPPSGGGAPAIPGLPTPGAGTPSVPGLPTPGAGTPSVPGLPTPGAGAPALPPLAAPDAPDLPTLPASPAAPNPAMLTGIATGIASQAMGAFGQLDLPAPL